MKSKMREKNGSIISNYLVPRELARMRAQERVLVDSSTISALVQGCVFMSEKRSFSVLKRLESRMSSIMGGKKGSIYFGQFIEMSVVEITSIFGSVDNIPIGIIKSTMTRDVKKGFARGKKAVSKQV